MAKILIVDDASFMRGTLKFICEKADHEVVGLAKDGKEALRLYEKYKPDIVTLDVLMEGADGLWALEAIISKYPTATIIMVTALGQEDKEKKARELGAKGYIKKPFKHTQIVDEIERVLLKGK